MHQFKSGREVKDYYTAALEGGDYYTQDERTCMWHGKFAERMGIGEFVTKENFARLAENINPITGERLTPRTSADRTVAYDVNFHCMKGVSLLYFATKDARILDAVRDATRETMREIEAQVSTRVRRNGQREGERHSGELIWGEFLHTTTRPVDGVPDPHLHIHCFVFNVTHDPSENRAKAAQFREIKRDMPVHEAAFHCRLAWKLEEIGYRIERRGKGWDVAGIPYSLKRKFSRRTEEIEALAERLNITDPARKAELGAKSRARKSKKLSPEELQREWVHRFNDEDRASLQRVMQQVAPNRDLTKQERRAAEAAVTSAIDHHYVHASVVDETRLHEKAMRFGVGKVRPEMVRELVGRHADLVRRVEDRRTLVTTRDVLAEEERMLTFARDGRGTCVPLEGREPWNPAGNRLSQHQTRAVRHLMQSKDRVMILRGGAGTAKTTLLREISGAMRERGHRLTVVAPTVDASRVVLRKEGFADANTLKSFLDSPERIKAAKGSLIWVDEAGLVGTPTMAKLFDVAKKIGARVTLCGDTKQHPPVERGDAMRLIESRVGIVPAELVEIKRQTGTYMESVRHVHREEYDLAIKMLDKMKAIREISMGDWTPVVGEFLDNIKSGRSAIVVCPRHIEGEKIAGMIRAGLRSEGKIGSDERLFLRLRDSLRWTDPEKEDVARYETGQVIQFHHEAGSRSNKFMPGDRFDVVRNEQTGEARMTGRDGKERPLPLKHVAAYGVYEPVMLPVAVGDQLRATSNGMALNGKHRIHNREVFRVAGFSTRGNILFDNGWEVPPQFGHLTHAYVSTSPPAQGRTVDSVMVIQSLGNGPAANANQFYVSISRGRKSVSIYTEDRKTLVDAVSRDASRRSAIELISPQSGQDRSRERALTIARLKHYERERVRPRQQERSQGREQRR